MIKTTLLSITIGTAFKKDITKNLMILVICISILKFLTLDFSNFFYVFFSFIFFIYAEKGTKNVKSVKLKNNLKIDIFKGTVSLF